jgi:hypothetical protein
MAVRIGMGVETPRLSGNPLDPVATYRAVTRYYRGHGPSLDKGVPSDPENKNWDEQWKSLHFSYMSSLAGVQEVHHDMHLHRFENEHTSPWL